MTLQARPRYGNAGGSGRRISDLEEVPVGKAFGAPKTAGAVKDVWNSAEFRRGQHGRTNAGVRLGQAATRNLRGRRGGAANAVQGAQLGRADSRFAFGKAETRREHKGRRAAAGAAIGTGLAHAPVAVSAGAVGAALEGKGNARALRNAATLYRPKHLAHIVSESPKYGAVLGGAALGGAALGAATGKKQPVGKARSFDPEHRRQRRYGMGEAALLGAGGVLGFRGIKGIRQSTALGRKISGVTAKDREAVVDLHSALKHGVVARRSDLAQLGGGVAGLGGAAALRQHAESRRGRAWN